MQVITKSELKLRQRELKIKIKEGYVFIHPTDTIYGVGCNALDSNAVKKIREIKGKYEHPFSVIAPSKEWIKQNCIVTKEAEQWLDKLPGPYTLILKLKTECIAPEVNPKSNSLGVRIPDHWFSQLVEAIGVPIVTTSANYTGKCPMTSLDNLNHEIKNTVDFTIYEGEKKGKPSNIIHLEGEETKVIER